MVASMKFSRTLRAFCAQASLLQRRRRWLAPSLPGRPAGMHPWSPWTRIQWTLRHAGPRGPSMTLRMLRKAPKGLRLPPDRLCCSIRRLRHSKWLHHRIHMFRCFHPAALRRRRRPQCHRAVVPAWAAWCLAGRKLSSLMKVCPHRPYPQCLIRLPGHRSPLRHRSRSYSLRRKLGPGYAVDRIGSGRIKMGTRAISGRRKTTPRTIGCRFDGTALAIVAFTGSALMGPSTCMRFRRRRTRGFTLE
mmetsp:Transcript_118884/g.341462  ORF Transcript_118884/g.341462 Transcript_118884/m.341462 type:complete len:246 (-) Transcript_118884:1016-1753(-)